MSNFDDFCNHINAFFSKYNPNFNCVKTIHDTSEYKIKEVIGYVFDDTTYNNLKVVSMDTVSQTGYGLYRNAQTKHVPNTSDAFLVDSNNIWYFIEFKHGKLNTDKNKDSINLKAAYNMIMLIDIFKNSQNNQFTLFNNDDPLEFFRNNCVYICISPTVDYGVSSQQNIIEDYVMKDRMRSYFVGQDHYTPDCLEKIKYFFYKDAYAYDPDLFVEDFLKKIVI